MPSRRRPARSRVSRQINRQKNSWGRKQAGLNNNALRPSLSCAIISRGAHGPTPGTVSNATTNWWRWMVSRQPHAGPRRGGVAVARRPAARQKAELTDRRRYADGWRCVRRRNKKHEKRASLTWLLLVLLDPGRLVPRVSPYIDRHPFSFSSEVLCGVVEKEQNKAWGASMRINLR